MTSVAIVEDHVILAEAIAAELRLRSYRVEILALDEPIPAQAQAADVDVVLLDLELGAGRLSGIDLIEPLVDLGLPTIILTGVTRRMVIAEAVLRGAAGVLSKQLGFGELLDAIEACIRGDMVAPEPAERVRLINELLVQRRDLERSRRPFDLLTAREREVLVALTTGQSPAEMSVSQFVSISTVRSHVKSIMRKLGVSSQIKAIALAREVGWPDQMQHRFGDDGSAG